MTSHKTGTREEWLTARLELLAAEKELARRLGLGATRAVALHGAPSAHPKIYVNVEFLQ